MKSPTVSVGVGAVAVGVGTPDVCLEGPAALSGLGLLSRFTNFRRDLRNDPIGEFAEGVNSNEQCINDNSALRLKIDDELVLRTYYGRGSEMRGYDL